MTEPGARDPVRAFFGHLLIAVGFLIMLLCGGCGAVFFLFYLVDAFSHPSNLAMTIFPLVLGGVPGLIGLGLFVVGRSLRRPTAPR
jgi:hypothetical protein